jgi:hypothetical protein
LLSGLATRQQIQVDEVRQVPLPEGAMINGIITDVDLMVDFLDSVAKEYALKKQAAAANPLLAQRSVIVIQASNIVTKIMEVPPLDEFHVRQFIQREFTQYADTSTAEPSELYDYTVLNQVGPEGGVQVLAASASREMIADYRQAFALAGYKVEQIGIGVESLIKLVGLIPDLVGKTYLLVQVEATRQIVTMFLDGTFRLSNGYRLISEPGSDEWVAEVGQNLASVIQFNRAQRGQTELGSALFAGMTPTNLEKLKSRFDYLNITIANFDLSHVIKVSANITAETHFDPGNFLFNLGALIKR